MLRAERGGREAIRAVFDSGDLQAVDKDKEASTGAHAPRADGAPAVLHDPQTLADLESQKIIIGNLVRVFGADLRIVGEEGELENSTGEGARFRQARHDRFSSISFPPALAHLPLSDVTVWVDPLDGTREFTLGYVNYVTVLVGISLRGRAIAGVVHQPFYGGKYVQKFDPLNPTFRPAPEGTPAGRTMWGAVGVGVRGIELADLAAIAPTRSIVTTTRSHFSPALQALLEQLKPDAVIRCGGAGSKGLLVLSGEAGQCAEERDRWKGVHRMIIETQHLLRHSCF